MDFKWIDLIHPSREDLQQLARDYGIHPILLQDCLDPEHLPKFEKVGDIHFIILRAYDASCQTECDTVQELTRKVAIFISDRFLITIHRKHYSDLEEIQRKWSHLELDTSKAPLLLSEILEAVFMSYERPIDASSDELEKFEIETFETSQTSPDLLRKGYFLKRKVSVIKRMLRMSMDVLIKINTHLYEKQTPHAQDLKDTLDSLYFFAEDLMENINNLLNLHISLSSQKTNEVMRLLTVISLFFLPLNFIASVYGMNFEHMPELKNEYGYPIVLSLMTIVAISIFLWFKRQGWLKKI